VSELRFEWDERKDAENRRKHGVSFEEARTVFYDDRALLRDDPDGNEERFVLFGALRDTENARGMPLLSVARGGDSDHFGAQGPQGRADRIRATVEIMRKKYDFSKARRNPYARKLKKQITIRLDEETLEYFRQLSAETEIPYQTLINLYLGECARTRKRPAMRWKPGKPNAA
jgi:predicted DNA binding CopG/RHH family protein